MSDQRIIIHSSLVKRQYFFSDNHCQEHGLGKDWVPVTHTLPFFSVPREGLEDGLVDTVEKLILVFYSDMKQIPNPNGNTFLPILDESGSMTETIYPKIEHNCVACNEGCTCLGPREDCTACWKCQQKEVDLMASEMEEKRWKEIDQQRLERIDDERIERLYC